MKQPKILVVEDEALLAEDIAENLEEMNFTVAGFASTGKEAIRKSKSLKPDLILMDIRLRGTMDGIEAATEIRKQNQCAIVFQTAYAEDPTLERATSAEPYGYLVKPVGKRELKATIRMALYKAQMEAEREELRKELEHALEEVRTLRGFLPVCAWCKKIRDDEGYWKSLEEYLTSRAGARVSHGICPSCAKKYFGGAVSDQI